MAKEEEKKMSEQSSSEPSKVDELREDLYSRTEYKEPTDERTPVDPLEDQPEVEGDWKSEELDEMLAYERRSPEGHPAMKKIFISAIIFFIAAAAIASYMFLGGSSFISTKNVDISVAGPVSASAGDVLELGIVVSNTNNADLEVANLSIQYPQGSRDPEDPTKSLSYIREELGEISAGGEVNRTGRVVLFGEQGDIQEIKISVEYKVRGSSATFRKDKVYEIVIGETPVSMSVSQPQFVNSGDVFTTTITLTQNSPEALQGVMLRGEYPYGYEVLESSLNVYQDNNLWIIGDLAPGAKKTLTLTGRLTGENEEERTFRFYLGVADPREKDPKFGTNLVSAFETIAISRPSVALDMRLNNSTGSTYVAPAGQNVSARISFQNNLSDKVVNPRVEVRFRGDGLDRESVSAHDGGFYDSGANKITWNIIGATGAGELLPGVSRSVSFSFSSVPSTTTSGEIGIEAVLIGTVLSSDSRQVTVALEKTVLISSQVSLSSAAVYSTGPFTNTGPLPPKVGEETTYTVSFSAGNTQNDIEGAVVTAKLGPSVKWVSSTEGVEYNEISNTVTWKVGTLASGTGFSTPERKASFQVSLTPSLSQVGTAPTLVSGISFSGKDSLTSQTVSVTNSPISTKLTSDPRFVQGDDRVVR